MPAGPMPSGIPNEQKSKVRQAWADGKASKAELMEVEAASYHAPGTCTFYGTANSNQMLMEIMGLHLPGASFEAPDTPLRDALTAAAAQRAARITALGAQYLPLAQVIDERSIVNAVVGLLATGGDTDRLFPEFIVSGLPRGVAGLVLASIFAVAMSNASGSLNSLASSSIVDFERLRGSTALDAAATVHSDIARGFIRCEVIRWDDLVGAGGHAEAARASKQRLEGKTYVVGDGDVLNVRFNV